MPWHPLSDSIPAAKEFAVFHLWLIHCLLLNVPFQIPIMHLFCTYGPEQDVVTFSLWHELSFFGLIQMTAPIVAFYNKERDSRTNLNPNSHGQENCLLILCCVERSGTPMLEGMENPLMENEYGGCRYGVNNV